MHNIQNNDLIPHLRATNYNTDYIQCLDPMMKEEFDQTMFNQELNNHIYMLASTGSGKSELLKLLYVRLESTEASIVIFDPHGDLALQCGRMINEKEDIIYIDPTLDKDLTPTINPFKLENKDEETIEIMAQEIINALESIVGEDFTTNMETLLTPLIYTLLRKGDSGIDELLRFLDDEDNEDLIKFAKKSPIRNHRNFMANQFSKDKFKVTKDALSTKLQLLLNNPTFSNFITGDSTLNLEKALNSKKIIIFRLPKSKMRKTLEPAGKLVMALIQGIVLKRSDKPKIYRPKTYLICDEYQNFFGQISNEMLSESRKNNLFIIGAHQYLTQLTTKSRDGLMSGAHTKIIGKNSNKDLKMMSEEIDVDLSSLKNLNLGEFYIQNGSNQAVRVKTIDKYIDDTNLIDSYIWEEHLKYQKKHFYRRIDDNKKTERVTEKEKSLPVPKFEED